MNPDWIFGLIGGLMIGAAAALFLLMNGRVMGASGLIGGLVDGSAPRAAWPENAGFVAGLTVVPALMVLAGMGAASAPVASWPGLIVAGLLVGFGTRLANGCTSGHGVCGISRLSRRGLAATGTYLVTGVLGVLIARALGWGV
ncbi:MAG: YeeE/YedE family protein [Paracoccus sp. (in: a-proteobacteria)]|nr:YeeE/YedE family protein [Paracoccus sp. (in: a-proteobacteria)]